MRPLRIAQIAPIARAVSRTSTGSIEQLVWLLTEELVERGHDVTLFATGHSETSARLEAKYALGYDHDEALWEWTFHELMHVAAAMERAQEFEVIHSHVYHFALPFTRFVRTPTVHSYHVLPDDDVVRAYADYPDAELVAASAYQREQLGRPEVPVVHHGLDVDGFPFGVSGGEYLLFLGDVRWEKGAGEAAELAARIGLPLLMAGPGEDFYREHVEPHISGDVEYLGWVEPARRDELLAGAAALLYPLNWPETFGLVLVEAMACGTPVLARSCGAVPEIVDNGVTGFHAESLEELVALAPRALKLDRARVRERARERFDKSRMADEYEALYRRLARRFDRRSA
jgi:glycosyltransferase involved in cell wall biosynthesis